MDVEAADGGLAAKAPAVAPAPAAEGAEDASSSFSRKVRIGVNASWAVNITLLVSKVCVFLMSGSYAVLASAIDSLVDLLSQAVLAVAEYQVARWDQRFPIGRTRMAELSVLCCALIMFVSTALVIRESAGALWSGFHGDVPRLEVGVSLIAMLATASVFKLALWIYCRALRKNPIMVALAEDHLNDVMTNVAAIAGAAVSGNLPKYWYVDPIVAVVFSLFIIRNWIVICVEQGQKMIGLAAPEELIDEVSALVDSHHTSMQLDRVTAYHHGSHMVVELEVILPGDMTVMDSHDIALALQHKVEAVEGVERAFVHVDYQRRDMEEHKVERNLKMGERDVMKPLQSADSSSLSDDTLLLPDATSNGHCAPSASASALCELRPLLGERRTSDDGADGTIAGSTPHSESVGLLAAAAAAAAAAGLGAAGDPAGEVRSSSSHSTSSK